MSNLIGNKPNQVPTNSDLGTLAFLDKEALDVGIFNTTNSYTVNQNFSSINVTNATLTSTTFTTSFPNVDPGNYDNQQIIVFTNTINNTNCAFSPVDNRVLTMGIGVGNVPFIRTGSGCQLVITGGGVDIYGRLNVTAPNVQNTFGPSTASISISNAPNYPYIDFNCSNTVVDYNARISCIGATSGTGGGTLTYEAAQHTFSGNLVIPNASGYGIKLNNASPAFGWRDITSSIEVRGTGSANPSWAAWLGNMYAYSFSATVLQECWQTYHMPHDYAPGTDIYFHAHWLTTGTNTGVVRWGFEYSHAKGHNQANFPASTTTVYAEQAGQGTAYRHMVTETIAVTIAGLEPDSIILVRVIRDAAHLNDTQTDAAFLLTADIHYQSTGIATKNKAPNFYT